MKTARLTFFLLCAGFFSLRAQVNTFDKQYRCTFNNSLTCFTALEQTGNKDYLLARDASDSSNLHTDQYCEFFRLNREGNPVWGKRFFKDTVGLLYWQTGNAATQTSDAGYLLGSCKYYNGHDPQIVLMKTDSNGMLTWSAKFPGEGTSRLFCAKQTSDSGYIVCGSTIDTNGVESGYIFKTDAGGNYTWGKKLALANDSLVIFVSVLELPGQGYVLAGSSAKKALIARFDLNGNLDWCRTMFSRRSSFYSVVQISPSSLVFGGSYNDSVGSGPYATLLKTDLSGNLAWVKGFQPASSFYYGSYTWSVQGLKSGNFAFAGYASTPIPTTFIGTADSSGSVSWCNEYHSTFHSFNYTPVTLISTSDGGFALVGMEGTLSGPNPVYSTVMLKTDANGNPGCDGVSYAIPFVSMNDTLSSEGFVSNCGAAVPYSAVLLNMPLPDTVICENIADHDPTGIAAVTRTGFELEQNTPNPFSGQTRITYHLDTRAESVLFEVYDARGTKVFEQVQSEVQPGEYTLTLDKDHLSRGMYFYSLQVDGKRLTKKMILD